MQYTIAKLKKECSEVFDLAKSAKNLEDFRERLFRRITSYQFDIFDEVRKPSVENIVRVRDCTRTMRSILKSESDRVAGFSVVQALYDISRDKARPDLQPGFYAEMIHIIMGMQGRGPGIAPSQIAKTALLKGRPAAINRSDAFDRVWRNVEAWMSAYTHGLQADAIKRREKRKKKICSVLKASEADWNSWQWHLKNVVKNIDLLEKLVTLSEIERKNIKNSLNAKLPFGVTPYYLHLMDDNNKNADRAIRAQVFPPENYVHEMSNNWHRRGCSFDFMLEYDTSPIDLVTRRYPGIAIFKPYNTCPQICVYCQRNWEIETAMAKNALAPSKIIDNTLEWIADHPAIHELLITGGDPLALNDRTINKILSKVSKIKSIEHIRIGSRTPVTVPMRITNNLIEVLKKYNKYGRQNISLVTHVEHAYEITPQLAQAISQLREIGIPVYNQLVFTFYTSRRFESSLLRRMLRKVGIDPYYTFNTKGKHETRDYIVPIARLLQETYEEARLLPGLTRTDEPVYNAPGLGKNYLRAHHHRDLVSILPDGSRVYEFHPWDRTLFPHKNYSAVDVPIYSYLERLKSIGENISAYQTIWYYY